MIDGHAGFLCLDKNDMPMVALHWEKYFQHICEKYNKIYKEESQNFWYDFEAQKGEWVANGTVIPIKMEFTGVTPVDIMLRIYDISGEHEKEILFARGELIDANTFVSQELSGTMFYKGTVTGIKIVKTSK